MGVPSAYWLGGASAAADDLRSNWGIRSSVMWRYAKLIKGGKMERCGISGIGVPSIAWISLGEPRHQLITKHLRHNGRAGNRIDAGVSLDNGFVWADKRTQFLRGRTVNKCELNWPTEATFKGVDRPLHGTVGCSSWIESFNLSCRCGTEPIGNRCTTNDRVKVLTLVA